MRWEHAIDSSRVGPISLPVRLDWSPRIARAWNYGDGEHRRELYRIMLDVGDAVDIITYTDPDELAAWSDELLVSRSQRRIVSSVMDAIASDGFVIAGGCRTRVVRGQ